MKKNSKIAIIGAGYVGATICYALTIKEVAQEIVLIDINKEKAIGEVLDIMHGIPYMGTAKVYQGDYEDCRDCDIIIVTAGINRKPGQERRDLIKENKRILYEISQRVKEHYNGGVILIVSNPVDSMTYHFTKWMDLEDGKVMGTGCILDTSRLVSQIAEYVGLSIDNIQATVIGEHGAEQYPIWSRVTVANIPIEEYCKVVGLRWDDEVRSTLMKNVQKMGAEIISRKEKTHYGIATCVAYLAEAMINNHMIVASVSSVLRGEYGIKDIALSVPSIVGREGIVKRLQEKWSDEEVRKLQECGVRLKTWRMAEETS